MGNQIRESIISRIVYNSAFLYDLSVFLVHFGARGKRYELIPRSGGRLLEIGCGTGKSSLRTNETMHVDINPKFLKRGLRKKRFSNAICASAYHLPFKEKTFDSILVPDTFHHLVLHHELFRECRRTLKDNNARLCIFDPVKLKNGTNRLQSTADGITWDFTLQGLRKRILKLSKTHKFKIQSS